FVSSGSRHTRSKRDGSSDVCSADLEGRTFKKALQIFRREANQHISPNSGWGEGSVAALLGIQLRGVNYYHGKNSLSPTIDEAIHTLQTNHNVTAIVIMQRTVLDRKSKCLN